MEKHKIIFQNQWFISKLAGMPFIENAKQDKKSNFRPGPINLKSEKHTSFFSYRDFETKPKEVRADEKPQGVKCKKIQPEISNGVQAQEKAS
jgi:hypothetical protein